MQVEPAAEILEVRQVRRAYEWGRLRTSLRRSLAVVVPVAVIATAVTGREALLWIPVTLAVWVLAHWRGGPLLRGAFFGLAGGAITYVLPMSVLRPCCTPEAMAAMTPGSDCCTMPGACLGAGALVGFALAAFVPAGSARWRTTAGIALGVASVAILKCATLFAGEAVGLVGGILAGVAAASLARAVVGRRAVS
jgi:hypothetical protein